MNQPTLFAQRSQIELEFDAFDSVNPEVWHLFARFAREAMAAGHGRFSADAIVHRIRWETSVITRGGRFKINNDFAACYARKFVRLFPGHAGLFEFRRRKA